MPSCERRFNLQTRFDGWNDFYLKSALEKPVNKNMPRGNVHLFYSELVVKLKIITIKI